MIRYVGVGIVIIGALFLAKTMLYSWMLLLLLALAFAIAAAAGTVGRWGYAAAVVCALLVVPGALFSGFRMLLRMAPLLLVLFGLYMLIRPRGE